MARPSLISSSIAELANKERQRRQSLLTSSSSGSISGVNSGLHPTTTIRAKSNHNPSRASTPGPSSVDKGEKYLQHAIEKIRRKYTKQNQILAQTNSQCVAKIRCLEDRVDELLRENAQLRIQTKKQQQPQKIQLDRAMRSVEDKIYDRFVEIFDVFRDVRIQEDLPDNEKINIFRLHRELEEALTSTPIEREGFVEEEKKEKREEKREGMEQEREEEREEIEQEIEDKREDHKRLSEFETNDPYRFNPGLKMATISESSRERSRFDSDDDIDYTDERFEGIENINNEDQGRYNKEERLDGERLEELDNNDDAIYETGNNYDYETVEEIYNQEIDANYEKEVEEFRRKEARKEEETRKLLAMMLEVELNLKRKEELKKQTERIKKQQEEEKRIENELLQQGIKNERKEEIRIEKENQKETTGEIQEIEEEEEEARVEKKVVGKEKEAERREKAASLVKQATDEERQRKSAIKIEKSTDRASKPTTNSRKTRKAVEQENEEVLHKRPRRATKEVDYKPPSLSKKLRRKSNVLFTAVGEEERRPLANITNKGNQKI